MNIFFIFYLKIHKRFILKKVLRLSFKLNIITDAGLGFWVKNPSPTSVIIFNAFFDSIITFKIHYSQTLT